MVSSVYFLDLKADYRENRLSRIARLLDQVPFIRPLTGNSLVAVKVHFGEKGNTAFVNPLYLRPVTDKVREWGGRPFLTDTTTLYVGSRSDAPVHLITALENGFSYTVVGAPVIIADGLKGRSAVEVPVNGKHFQRVSLAADIVEADALISIAHFKGHELAGFGGTLKNLGMGCASRKGKLSQHARLAPKVVRKKCIGCGECLSRCPSGAISFKEQRAGIEATKCLGCGTCLVVCPQQAVRIRWDPAMAIFQEKMVEYVQGVLRGKEGRAIFLNILTDITPACDCCNHSDRPIVPDIGFLASHDPVAIDQASADLVNRQPAMGDSKLIRNVLPGEDKFRGLYPQVDWEIQLAYAEQLGLGSRKYELIPLGEKPKILRKAPLNPS